jgi:hypothetical protein
MTISQRRLAPRPTSPSQEDEPLGLDERAEFAFDETPIDLDHSESEHLPLPSIDRSWETGAPSMLGDEPEGIVDPWIESIEDSVALAGSWIETSVDPCAWEHDALVVESTAGTLTDDVEGPEQAQVELAILPPLDRIEESDDSEGPFFVGEDALEAQPPAFELSKPARPSSVSVSSRDADAMARARKDTLRTHDGIDRPSPQRRPGDPSTLVAAVRSRELLAFAFSKGPGKLSYDGGETFVDAPWMRGATALAASGEVLFAAVYDGPVDRCTIVRATATSVERVADVHEILEGEEGCVVRELVVLRDDGEQLLVRTAHKELVLSLVRGR